MSQENVEIVWKLIEAFNRRDAQAIDALWHPEGEFRSAFGAMEGKTYRGGGNAQAYIDDIDATWDDWHTYDERVLDAGGERVAQLYRVTGTGKGSGVRIDANIAIVYTLRNGLVWRGDVYLDQAEALEAAGLSE